MAPRRTASSIVVLATAAAVASFGSVDATMYTCVIYGNGVPNSIKNKIDVDTSTLLQKLKDYEGSGYTAVAPGQLANRRRDLVEETASTNEEEENAHEQEIDKEENEEHRELLISCPNSCSNSGSTYCKSIGCAYCGTCSRRRDLATTFHLRGLASATSVEVSINKDLATYCQGITGCSLWSQIYVVNDDGSLTLAR